MKQSIKVKWYSKGKFSEEDLEMKIDPYLKITKYHHDDKFSYKRYRYWVINVDDDTLLDVPDKLEFIHHKPKDDIEISDEEFALIKNGTIKLTNNKGEGSNSIQVYTWNDLIKYFPEESIYI
jgi:hypothetical protein